MKDNPMKNRYLMLAVPGLLSLLAAAQEAPVRLESKGLALMLDPAFPRLIQYQCKGDGATLDGQIAPTTAILLNGQAEPCTVSFKKTGKNSGEYRLAFVQANVEITLQVTVGEACVELKVTRIQEKGAVKVKTFAFPNNALLTISSAQPDAAVATLYGTGAEAPACQAKREWIGSLAGQKSKADTGNYFFASAGKLAAGIASNHVHDVQRIAYQIAEKDGVSTCTAQNPVWRYREIDAETVPLPVVNVFVTGDRNGDGRATWQDAALVYRATLPKPYGSEFVKTTVGENIAMNFASGAQQPFLKILDEVKKGYLATDGLGQSVVIKGFSSEGHDSANTDYGGHFNTRAGGLKEFNILLEHAREYNARIGIHINASEVYPEAQRYHPDILLKQANGNLVGGWSWLDHAILIDKVKDTTSGRLFAALDQMKREIPKLDFVYVDTYWTSGWVAWKIADKLKSLKLPIYTEGDVCLDPWSVWGHWRGSGSQIMQFLWYSDRELSGNDPILRGGRADSDGFMGWQNQHSFQNFVTRTFTTHLPATYLQNFELLRFEPGKEAIFSAGVRVSKNGELVTVSQNGRTVMTWTGGGANNRLFVPWDPQTEAKIYVWDEAGTEQAWQLPAKWKDAKTVYLYKLTDMGRTEETKLAVTDGKVTLKVDKGVPYVLYPKRAPKQKDLNWGEGSPVKDPGFESHGFASWKPSNPEAAKIENDGHGNARLMLSSAAGAEANVSQVVTGLVPGKTYAASAWVQISGKAPASLWIASPSSGGVIFMRQAYSVKVDRTNVRHSAPNDPRTGTNYQRIRVVFTVPFDKASVFLSLGQGIPGAQAEFDDVRIVETEISPEAVKHFFWEDFEHVETGGYGPFTGCPGERTHLAEAHLPYTNDTINGKFSLKTRDGGRVLRTLPCTIRFKPYTKYKVSVETLSPGGKGRLTADSNGKTVMTLAIPEGRNSLTAEFATGKDTESYLSLFRDGGDFLTIDDLAIDELGTVPAPPVVPVEDPLAGKVILLDEAFAKPLDETWTIHKSARPGTSVKVADGTLAIAAAANVSTFVERQLPEGATAFECQLDATGDAGQTWGPGMTLLWANGKALRVNLRGEDRKFGVDSEPGGQTMVGSIEGDGIATLRIRLTADQVLVDARTAEDAPWQALKAFPRATFPGDPDRVRLGKTHAIATDDNDGIGSKGQVTLRRFRAGK
jgi:endo-alpha-N-acetylgalactosaminidase